MRKSLSKFLAAVGKWNSEDKLALPAVMLRYARNRACGKNIICSTRTKIKGLANISTGGLVDIGLRDVGFVGPYERTYLNVEGELRFSSKYSIGLGCRLFIGAGAAGVFHQGFITAASTFVIRHSLEVGQGSAISWGCWFLDDDFHEVQYEGRRAAGTGISIGPKVLIASNVTILKGTVIPEGCVVASGSVVRGIFEEKNALIAGSPGKVVRRNVSWN